MRREEKRCCEINSEKGAREMTSKEAVKPLEECAKERETIELYFQQGSSDKVHQLQLDSVEEKWSVNAQEEQRGSALQSDTKVSSVAYEEVRKPLPRRSQGTKFLSLSKTLLHRKF
jgi:hypothetical protein